MATENNREDMYVVEEKGMFVLRQTRYRKMLEQGSEHPHDTCAFARSVEEMHGMVDKYWSDIDYSAVEKPASRKAATP